MKSAEKTGPTLRFLWLAIVILSGSSMIVRSSQHTLGSDNFLIVDGRPFFPIGIYSVNPLKRWDPPTAFGEIKAAGFNSVQSYECDEGYLKEYIRQADSAGLKVLVYPGSRMERRDFDSEKVKKTVRDLLHSRAVLSWYLAEEPDASDVDTGHVEHVRKDVRAIDTLHPLSIMISDPKKYRMYAGHSDIFMIERYPVPNQPVTDVAEHVEMARKAVDNRCPVWIAEQAFGYQNERNKGWGWKREPTLPEMRAMTYLAIVKGARGIFYYTYHGSQYFIKDSPHHWEELKSLAGELKAEYTLLVSPEVGGDPVTATVQGHDRPPVILSVRRIVEGDSSMPAGFYVIAVNGIDGAVAASFSFHGMNPVRAVVVSENRSIPVAGGAYSDTFAPYGVHIYRLD